MLPGSYHCFFIIMMKLIESFFFNFFHCLFCHFPGVLVSRYVNRGQDISVMLTIFSGNFTSLDMCTDVKISISNK